MLREELNCVEKFAKSDQFASFCTVVKVVTNQLLHNVKKVIQVMFYRQEEYSKPPK